MEVCAMHIDVLGTRPPEELAYIRSDQALQFLAAIPYKPKKVSRMPALILLARGCVDSQLCSGCLQTRVAVTFVIMTACFIS